MKLERSDEGHNAIIKLVGNFDASALNQVREAAIEPEPHALILDFSEVGFIDSSGIGLVVSLFKQLRAKGGTLLIASVGGQPQDSFKMFKIDQVIAMCADLDEARQKLSA